MPNNIDEKVIEILKKNYPKFFPFLVETSKRKISFGDCEKGMSSDKYRILAGVRKKKVVGYFEIFYHDPKDLESCVGRKVEIDPSILGIKQDTPIILFYRVVDGRTDNYIEKIRSFP